jgi:sec-independent protein translocase protein TatB
MPSEWIGIPGWGEPVRAFIGWQETAAIFVVILILFGPKSIPEVARLLGKLMQQFRDASAELQRNLYMDDVRDLQRELRDSWRAKPERMRTVKPQPASEPKAPAPEADPYPAQDSDSVPPRDGESEDDVDKGDPMDGSGRPQPS